MPVAKALQDSGFVSGDRGCDHHDEPVEMADRGVRDFLPAACSCLSITN